MNESKDAAKTPKEDIMNDNTNQTTNQSSSQPTRPSVKQLLANKRIRFGVVGAAVVIVVIIILLAWMPWQKKTTANTASGSKPPAVAVVEITPTGFVPSTLSVRPNTDVVWVNEDVNPHLPAADPYPTHASMPSLVAPRALGQKETYSFKVSKVETIRYHDDLNPTTTGTIVVQ